MAIYQVLVSIGMIFVSFIIGFIVFYITSRLLKEDKKKQIEEVISQLINLVIFIWVGKILTNSAIFIRDPIAILAYPSNAQAFYLATLFTGGLICYKVLKKQLDFTALLTTFVPVFLVASFTYEFLQIVYGNGVYSWAYQGLLVVLVLGYLLLYDRVEVNKLSFILLLCWALGKIVLSLILPFTTVFTYIIAPWYAILLFSLFLGLFSYYMKKDVA